MITVTMDMVQYDCPYIDTSDDFDVTVSGMHWDFHTDTEKLETRVLIKASDTETLTHGLDAVRNHHAMDHYELLVRRNNRALIRNMVDQTAAMRVIRSHNGYLTGPFEAEAGSELWHVGFDTREAADDALADLEIHNDFTVESREAIAFDDYFDLVRNIGPAKELIDACRDLTEVERATLERALEEGYYETPRDATLSTLAEVFDVSNTAVSKNLRRGEGKVVRRLVQALRDLD